MNFADQIRDSHSHEALADSVQKLLSALDPAFPHASEYHAKCAEVLAAYHQPGTDRASLPTTV